MQAEIVALILGLGTGLVLGGARFVFAITLGGR